MRKQKPSQGFAQKAQDTVAKDMQSQSTLGDNQEPLFLRYGLSQPFSVLLAELCLLLLCPTFLVSVSSGCPLVSLAPSDQSNQPYGSWQQAWHMVPCWEDPSLVRNPSIIEAHFQRKGGFHICHHPALLLPMGLPGRDRTCHTLGVILCLSL